jgi:hypothetical protein
VFKRQEALAHQTNALSALADVWDNRGNVAQAIALERQALSLRNRLPDPRARAMSHGNLANYLAKAGRTDEMTRHELAAGIYVLASGYGQHVSTWLRNLRVRMRLASSSGRQYRLPAISAQLALPEFADLKHFLQGRQVEVAQLQAKVDQLVEQVRQAAAGDGLDPS